MKILVISDIHSNLNALESVLTSAGQVDWTWCLGDLVGYGPDPNDCVELIRSLPNLVCLMGNHDAAVIGKKSIERFNDEAGGAVLVTKKMISPSNLIYLHDLPETVTIGQITLAHGSPRNPIWEYVIDPTIAEINFDLMKTPYAFVGHSHIPILFTRGENGKEIQRMIMKPGEPYQLSTRTILNPGSVGQPRDYDPRASYGIFDDVLLTWEIHRVEYDIKSVQDRIIKAGLPQRQALRLAEGW